MLCAPQFYLDGRETAQLFDIKVSYGEIAAFLRAMDTSTRSQYRADFLESAAQQSKSLWTRKDDQATNEFWDAATMVAGEEFGILDMKKQVLTKDSTWITLRPGFMPTGRKQVSIMIKGDRGFVDLTFSNTDAAKFRVAVKSLLEPGMAVCQTTGWAAIRIEVPAFRILDGIEFGLPKVRVVLAAAAKLARLYQQHRPLMDQAVLEATPTGAL